MPVVGKKQPEVSDAIRPYTFHRVDLNTAGKEARGECPFCGGENKFTVTTDTGMFRCLSCNVGPDKSKPIRGGNAMIFIRELWEKSAEREVDLSPLAEARGYLSPAVLRKWGVAKSLASGDWIIPGYDAQGVMKQLYRYAYIEGSYKLLASPKPLFHNQLFGMNLFVKSRSTIIICEGPWDAIAIYEILSQTKRTETGFAVTGNPRLSLLNEFNVIALPGCNTFHESWLPLFKGKHVVFMFDNDHPKKNLKTEQMIPPAGLEGVRRIAGMMAASSNAPESISYLKWGTAGYNPSLPSGTDLRDLFKASGASLGARIKKLQEILDKVSPVESEWLTEAAGASHSASSDKVGDYLPCNSYKTLINSWRKAMKWTDGLDCALSAMLSSVASVRSVGDQLWLKIIGPASCGKTSIAQALGTASEYVICEDVIRGFTSGWKEGGGSEGNDYDLASRIRDKTMITMDGDTLMQSPTLPTILGEARRLFDGSLSSHFRNGTGKSVEKHRFTWVICGTSSLRSMDSSELGERFLDVVIMEGIDDEHEDEILERVANRVVANMGLEVGKDSGQHDVEMTEAMKLTGGYVAHLRENAIELLSQLEVSKEALHLCTRFGKFVAFMRARPSKKQDENAEREFAARLVSQHIRLATCEAVVLNRTTIDSEVLRRVRLSCLATARGKTLEIARHLFANHENGLEVRSLALLTNDTEVKVRELLRFLKRIEVADVYQKEAIKGLKGKPAWKLTPRLYTLWKQVHEII